jgi:hypothetical protein
MKVWIGALPRRRHGRNGLLRDENFRRCDEAEVLGFPRTFQLGPPLPLTSRPTYFAERKDDPGVGVALTGRLKRLA